MDRRLSPWLALGLSLCFIFASGVYLLVEARTQRRLTVRTELRPVGWPKSDVLWFAPGAYWVDDFDGGVQSGTLDQTAILTLWNSNGTVNFGPGFIRFEQAGGVKEGTLRDDTSLCVVNTASNSKVSVTFMREQTVELGYDGCVMKGTLAQEATLKSWDGGSKTYPPNTLVDFNGAGLVTRAVLPPSDPTPLDGLYNGTCTVTGTNTSPFSSFLFGFRASKGVFAGSHDAELYSLQWQGNYDAKGTILNGLMTGWVDVMEGGQKIRWTIRGPIEGRLAAAAAGGTLTMTTADGKRTWTGSWTAAAGSGAGTKRPDFGPLDAGGMPGCLLELSPNRESAGWVLNSGTPYSVWAAPKRVGQPYTAAAWQTYGPWTLAGRRRYTFVWEGPTLGGNLANNDASPTSTELSPALASLGFRNLTGEPVWLTVNPLPPGRCRPGEETSGTGVAGPAAGTGWTLTSKWTHTYSSMTPSRYGSVAFTETTAIVTSQTAKTSHTWSDPPHVLSPGQDVSLKLGISKQSGTFGRAYTLVFYGSYSTRPSGWATGVMIPPMMDWAGAEADTSPLFDGRPTTFQVDRAGGPAIIDAALMGRLFLAGNAGTEASTTWSGKVPDGTPNGRFLLIVSSGHARRMDQPDQVVTVAAAGATYYEYVWKGK